jgi:type II secretory pathway pseudopilin PulG
MTGKHKKRGFSLIEAAVILAVVGLVLGGIWVAAAAMYENYKVNKTVEGVFITARNIQNLISIRDAYVIGGGGVEITSTSLASGAFPKNWIDTNRIKSPFGGSVLVFNYSPPINPDYRFLINFKNIYSSSCVKLVVKVSSAGAVAGSRGSGAYGRASLGIIGAFDGATNKYLYDFPVSIETATSFCSSNNNITEVGFSFGYTRTN